MKPSTDYEREIAELISHYSPRGMLVPATVSSLINLTVRQTLPTDDTTICAPYRRPFLIREIRFRGAFRVLGAATADTPVGGTGGMELSLFANLRIGRALLTNGYVPVAALCKREQYLNGEVAFPQIPPGNAPIIQAATVACADNSQSAVYTWKLDVPLLLPPGIPLSVQLQRPSSVGSQDNQSFGGGTIAGTSPASVTVAGAYFKEDFRISKVKCPYAIGWMDPSGDYNTATGSTILSTEADLRNLSGTDFEVWRIIGRLPARTIGANFSRGEYEGPEPLIRIGYSSGPAIIDPEKPFNSVFDFQTRSIETPGFVMPNGAVLNVKMLKKVNASLTAVGVFPVIGVVGTREVSL